MTKTISVQLPDSLLAQVDALAPNRDDFFRDAVAEKIARGIRPGPSVWEALHCGRGLELDIKPLHGPMVEISL